MDDDNTKTVTQHTRYIVFETKTNKLM